MLTLIISTPAMPSRIGVIFTPVPFPLHRPFFHLFFPHIVELPSEEVTTLTVLSQTYFILIARDAHSQYFGPYFRPSTPVRHHGD